MKVVPSINAPWQLLLLANVVAAAGLYPQSVLSRDSSREVASVDSRGNSLPLGRHDRLAHRDNSYTKASLEDVTAQVVRREDGTQSIGKAAPPIVQRSSSNVDGEVLLEMQASSGSAKIVVLFLMVTMALVTFCAGAIYLIWSPMSAMLEERAFEQAAKKSFLSAAPPSPPQDPSNAEDTAAVPLFSSEERLQKRLENISCAWSTFLQDQILQVDSNNVLYVTMQALFDKIQPKQFDDLFDEVRASTDVEHLTKQDFEKVLDGLDGGASGMAITASSRTLGPRMSSVKPVVGANAPFAVAISTEDYGWLFDSWDVVFPEQEPMTKECFPGVVKLVVAWNFIRTLHTARFMSKEARQSRDSVNGGASSSFAHPTMQLVINLKRTKPPLEVKVEVEFREPTVAPKQDDEEEEIPGAPRFQGAPKGTSETMREKLERKSKTVEEVKSDDEDGKSDGELAP